MNTAKRAALVLAATGAIVGTAAGTAAATGGAGAGATGAAVKSPGVISGNVVQEPTGIPINAVGNSLNLIGILNPTFGNAGATT